MTAERVSQLLLWLSAALSLWFIGLFLYISLPSLFYPFQLEWIEGQSVDTIYRVYNGKPVFAAPTIEYVPLLYTPFFYYISAAMAHLLGMDFVAGRMVSFLSALGILFLIYRWIRREGGTWQAALTASGLFAATYRISGRWFDLARVDSLALLLLILGLYLLRFGATRRIAILSGILLATSFFTKQLALGIAFPMLAVAILLRPRHGLTATASCAATLILGMAYLEWATEGWFSFFCFKVASGHTIDSAKIWGFWQFDVVEQQGFVLAAALLSVIAGQGRARLFWLGGLLIAALAATYSARLHRYGYINNLMPLHAILALLAGFILLSTPRLRAAGAACAVLQFIALFYNPTPFIPTIESVQTGNRFLKEIGRAGGEVFMPDVQFISHRVGKQSYSYGMGAYDLFRANLTGADTDIKNRLGKELQTAIAEGKFSVIIPGRLVHNGLPGLNAHYQVSQNLDYPEGYALDSLKIRSMVLYTPHKTEAEPHETELHPPELAEQPE